MGREILQFMKHTAYNAVPENRHTQTLSETAIRVPDGDDLTAATVTSLKVGRYQPPGKSNTNRHSH